LRTLQIHAKRFGYRVGEKAVESAEEIRRESGEAENALVAFITVERGDGEREAEEAGREICDHARRVGASAIVIYPYAHLSSSLESPERSKELLEKVESEASSCGMRVLRAPFGWYKEFSLDSFGHPMAELSRSFGGREPSLSAKLSKKLQERLFREYLPRFGLRVEERGFSIEEPWRSILFQSLNLQRMFCLREDPEDFAASCSDGGLIALTFKPGGEKLYDAALPALNPPSAEFFEVMRLSSCGDSICAEHEAEKIPLFFERGGRKFILVSSFVISMIADRLIALDLEKPSPPVLPIWYSPYQAAVLKVGDASASYVREVADEIREAGLTRVYVDDSPRKLGEKLREWGMKWTPFIFIVGGKEEAAGNVVLRVRKSGIQLPVKKEDVAKKVRELLEEEQMMRLF